MLGWSRFVVEGESMLPAFVAGDRLLVRRRPALMVGDVVVLSDPRDGRRILKRVSTIEPDGTVAVRGDNPDASTDSRHYGPVERGAICGVVVRRY